MKKPQRLRLDKLLIVVLPLCLFLAVWLASSPTGSDAPEGNAPATGRTVGSEAMATEPAAGGAITGTREVPVAGAVDDTWQLVANKVEADRRARETAGEILPQDFLDRIVTGGAVAIPLPDGTTAAGTVRMSGRDETGILWVEGRITRPAPGTYLLQRQTAPGVAGPFVGHVLFDDRRDGWKIEPTPDLERARFVLRDINEIICVDYPALHPDEIEAQPAEAGDGEVAFAPQDHPTDIPIPHYQPVIPLQSLPGATGVIYLDFDGEKGPFPGWGDFDAAPSGASTSQIFDVWRRVSEDFQGFNLNITTDRAVFDAAPAGRRQQIIITPTNTASPGAGGVAYVGSYNWTTPRPCWSFYTTGKSAAEVISHEIGHTLGLRHHGRTDPTQEYYGGHGSGDVGWAPIMGTGYTKNLTQWSKGEYLNANRSTQDDLHIIANNNNDVGYRPDDYGHTLATAGYLEILPDNSVFNEGIIERTGDIDAFRFRTNRSSVNLAINPVSAGPNLDIHAEIVNAQTLAVVVEDNPLDGLHANLSATLAAGEYLLRVRGTGRGDPLGDGYTNYGSLGTYLITGTVTNGIKPDRFAIAENSPNGTPIGTVAPRNDHAGAPLTFAFASGNTGGALAINPATGALTVANSPVLDFEALSTRWDVPAVIAPIIAINNSANPSLNETVRVVVTVIDVNEPPVWLSPTLASTIPERMLVGTSLGSLRANDPDRFQSLTYSITGGNPNGFFAIDPGSGELKVASTIEVSATTTFPITFTVTDSGSPPLSATTTRNITVLKHTSPTAPGRIIRNFFNDINGFLVSDLTGNAKFPDNPDSVRYLDSFDDEPNQGDRFGSTIRGYLIVPVTGSYRFAIASDDGGALLFASNGNPGSATQIASVSRSVFGIPASAWTNRYEWNKYSVQQSATFNLTAGQVCYIEAQHKEDAGGDHVAVAWTTPFNSDWQVIPGIFLAPREQNYAPRIPDTTFQIRQSAGMGQSIGFIHAVDANQEDTFHDFTIISGNSDGLFGIDPATGRLFVAVNNLPAAPASRVLTIRVSDSGTPSLSGTGNVTVHIFAAVDPATWTNPAGGSWPLASNWLDQGVAGGAGTTARFDTLALSANRTVTLDGTRTMGRLQFGDTSGQFSWTLSPGSGGTLMLDNNGDLPLINVNTRTATISAGIGGTSGLLKTGSGILALSGGNSYSGDTVIDAGTLQYASRTTFGNSTLRLAGGTRLQKINEQGNNAAWAMANNIVLTGGQVEMNVDWSGIQDQWFSGIISGTGSIRITGSGSSVTRGVGLAGNNTFTGGVSLNSNQSGARLGHHNGLGPGTLTVTGVTQNRGEGLGAFASLSAPVANDIVINSGRILNLGGGGFDMELSGVISGAGSLNTQVSGITYTLTGTNTYTGSTRVAGPTLQLGNGGTTGSLTGTSSITNNSNIRINRSNAFTQATDLNGKAITGTGSLTQAGTGTTTLTQANTYSGATTVAGGTLALVGGSLNSPVTVHSGAFLGFTPGAPATSTRDLTLDAGARIRIIGPPAAGSQTLFTTTGTITGTPELENPPASYELVLEGGNTLKLVAAADYYWNSSTTDTWTTGANWSDDPTSGGTTGTVPGSRDSAFFNQSSVNGATTVLFDADASVAGLAFANTGTTTLTSDSVPPRTIAIGSGGITINSGAGAVTLGDATNILNLSMGTAQTWTNHSANPLTVVNAVDNGGNLLTLSGNGNTIINGVISNSGDLAKNGTGTLTLTNANTSIGNTTINEGTLQLGNGGTTGALSTFSAITNNASLVINRSNTVTQGTDFANNIAGTGGVTKPGTGTLIMNHGNTYSGDTVVSAGTLRYSSRFAFGNSTLYLAGDTRIQKTGEHGNTAAWAMANNIVLTGGQVEMNVDWSGIQDQWFSGIISGEGGIRITGAGSNITRGVGLSGNNTFSGGVTLGSNRSGARLGHPNGLGTGMLTVAGVTENRNEGLGAYATLSVPVANDVVINSGRILNIGGGAHNMTLSGVISGAGNLNMQDSTVRTYTLTGTNTYTGTTRVAGPTLQLGNGGTTGSLTGTSAITNNSNITINRSNDFDQDTDLNGKAITGTGSLTQAGTGTTTLTQANTYTGATTVAGGTLALVGGSLDSPVTVSSEAFLGFTPGAPATSTRDLTLDAGARIRIIGSPTANSHTLFTTTGTITGTPELEDPIASYELVLDGGNTLMLVASNHADYLAWAAKFPDADLSDPNADFDGDGLTNDQERIFGLDPTDPASINPIVVPLDAATGTLSFTRRDPALTGILLYQVWYSTDLAGWQTDDDAVLTPGAVVDEVQTVAVKISDDLLDEPRLFLRISAEN